LSRKVSARNKLDPFRLPERAKLVKGPFGVPMVMKLASGLPCRVETNRLGRLRKFCAALSSLTSDGAELLSPEAAPAGQRLKISLEAAPGEAFELFSVTCQTDGLDGYRIRLRLASGTWPYQLYSKIAVQASTGPAIRETPPCLRHLELNAGCTVDDVEAAFARLVRRHHPDRGGSVDDFVRIRRAYLDSLSLLGGRR